MRQRMGSHSSTEESSPWSLWGAVGALALMLLCVAGILCGIVGMLVYSRPRGSPPLLQARETATSEREGLSPAPSPFPISTPTPSPTLPPPPSPTPSPTPTPIPSPTPTPEPTLTPQPTPSPTCPAVGGPFAALWKQYQGQLGCAINTAHTSWIAQEHFEHGQMFWRKDNDRIVVLYDNGTWALYQDIWNEGDPEYSCPNIAPTQCPPTPRRGFGKIWCTYSAVRQGLGWATDYEQGFHGTVQDFAQGTIFRTDTGEMYLLLGDDTWLRL